MEGESDEAIFPGVGFVFDLARVFGLALVARFAKKLGEVVRGRGDGVLRTCR
jgi:hypothetical protein